MSDLAKSIAAILPHCDVCGQLLIPVNSKHITCANGHGRLIAGKAASPSLLRRLANYDCRTIGLAKYLTTKNRSQTGIWIVNGRLCERASSDVPVPPAVPAIHTSWNDNLCLDFYVPIELPARVITQGPVAESVDWKKA